jgi:hypothetical protein
MSRKTIAWLSILVLVIAWGIQNNNTDNNSKSAELVTDQELVDTLSNKAKIDGNKIKHSMYQSSACKIKEDFVPVVDVLTQISKRKAIPPDLYPVLQEFMTSIQFLVMDDYVFRPDDGLTPDETLINDAIKKFYGELKLKTAELNSGIVSATNSYFYNLQKNVETLARPACALYESSNPDLTTLKSPMPVASPSKLPGFMDSELAKIGKQVGYDAICKLSSSGSMLLSNVEDALISPAFKLTLLEASKTTIYDLGYAAFLFEGKGLYIPEAGELHWKTDFESLKLELEKSRYRYWADSSKQDLKFIKITTNKIIELGEIGCAEVKKLKNS